MSALTKLFVVLLVVCSLMLSASVVVFVNRVEDFKVAADQAKLSEQNIKVRLNNSITDLQGVQGQLAEQIRTSNDKLNDLQGKLKTSEGKVLEQRIALAKDATDMQLSQAANKGLVDTLQASDQANKDLQASLGTLRAENSKLLDSNRELNVSVTDLTAKNSSLAMSNKVYLEEVEQGKSEVSHLTKLLSDNNIKADAVPASEAEAGNVDVKGVVKSVFVVAGVKYATISVGSSDNVVKGQKFNVVGNNGQFLGFLTISEVQPTEAVGRVDGPKINEIVPQVEVKTQL